MKDSIKVAAGAVAATLISRWLFDWQKTYGNESLYFALFVLFGILMAALGGVAFFQYDRQAGVFSKIIREQAETAQRFEASLSKLEAAILNQNQLSWLLSTSQLLELEKAKKKCKEIWIATKEPSDDTGDSPWVNVIQNNLGDGITYVYVCPEDESLHGALQGLKDVFRGRLGQCRILPLSTHDFERLPYSHIVIYDPGNAAGELDCLCEVNGPHRGWWLRLHNSQKNVVIGRLAPLAKNAKLLSDF